MAKRKNWISIDMYAFADYADKLDKLGADLKKTLGKAMEKGAAKVEKDVLADEVCLDHLSRTAVGGNGRTDESLRNDAGGVLGRADHLLDAGNGSDGIEGEFLLVGIVGKLAV